MLTKKSAWVSGVSKGVLGLAPRLFPLSYFFSVGFPDFSWSSS
jgi:hypothetical protein